MKVSRKSLVSALCALTLFASCSNPVVAPRQDAVVEGAEEGLPAKEAVETVPYKEPSALELSAFVNESSKAISSTVADAFEQDDTQATAKVINTDGSIQEHNFYDDATDWFKFTAVAGTVYNIESWVFDSADTVITLYNGTTTTSLKSNDDKVSGNMGSKIASWTAPASKVYTFKVASYNSKKGSLRNYNVSVSGGTVATTDSFEEDDTLATAKALSVGVAQSHNFSDDAVDYVKFTAKANFKYVVESTVQGSTDTSFSLMDAQGTVLSTNDDKVSGNKGSLVSLDCTTAGTYIVKITNYNSVTGSALTYSLSLTETAIVSGEVFNYSSTSPFVKLDFAGASSKTITVKGAAGKQLFLVKSNASGTAVAATGAGAVSNVQGLSEPAAFEFSIGGEESVKRLEHAKAANFYKIRPNIRDLPEAKSKASPVLYGDSTGAGFTVGVSTKKFWVENAAGTWIQASATLRAIGRYAYVWVADANFDSSNTATKDNKVSQARVDEIKNVFDGSASDSYAKGIFKQATNVFGYENGGGTSGTGGRDSDQHVSVFVYDIGYDFTSTQSGGVLGYFWGKDYYTQQEIDDAGYAGQLYTNNAEMFYVDAHFTDGWPKVIYSTLAHEYQHMINFAMKSLKYNVDTSAWCNEMNSMVCEDLLANAIGVDASARPASRFEEFNPNYVTSGVTDWLEGDAVLNSYASAYAFGAYLLRNFGGAPLFKAMANNALADVASVTSALSSVGSSDNFDAAFKKYAQALVFNTTSNSVVKTFNIGNTTTVGDTSYTIDPINIYSYSNGTSMGPVTYAPSASQALRPYGNSIHTSSAWTNLAGDLTVTLTKPTSTTVEFTLLVK